MCDVRCAMCVSSCACAPAPAGRAGPSRGRGALPGEPRRATEAARARRGALLRLRRSELRGPGPRPRCTRAARRGSAAAAGAGPRARARAARHITQAAADREAQRFGRGKGSSGLGSIQGAGARRTPTRTAPRRQRSAPRRRTRHNETTGQPATAPAAQTLASALCCYCYH